MWGLINTEDGSKKALLWLYTIAMTFHWFLDSISNKNFCMLMLFNFQIFSYGEGLIIKLNPGTLKSLWGCTMCHFLAVRPLIGRYLVRLTSPTRVLTSMMKFIQYLSCSATYKHRQPLLRPDATASYNIGSLDRMNVTLATIAFF